MESNIHSLPGHHTQSYQLLELIAISGDFPADLLHRLPGGTSYKESIVKSLKRKRLIRTFYRNGLRTYRLTALAKNLLQAEQPDRFSFYLTGNTDTNLLKSEITRRLRLNQIATVYMNMLLAGIHIFRDDKPEIFSPKGSPASILDKPAFYSSREIKDIGLEAIKIRGSRMTGALLSPAGVYIVYNSGTALAKWETRSELRVKALIQMELCQRRLPGQYKIEDVNALLFGDSMSLVSQFLIDRKNYFVLDGNYNHFYFFTNDHYGETLLRILCNPDIHRELERILSQGLKARIPNWHMENDAIDKNGEPVLFEYLFDIPRIVRFSTALELQGRNGTLICFDFQSSALSHCFGGHIRFQTIDFNKFERRFFL